MSTWPCPLEAWWHAHPSLWGAKPTACAPAPSPPPPGGSLSFPVWGYSTVPSGSHVSRAWPSPHLRPPPPCSPSPPVHGAGKGFEEEEEGERAQGRIEEQETALLADPIDPQAGPHLQSRPLLRAHDPPRAQEESRRPGHHIHAPHPFPVSTRSTETSPEDLRVWRHMPTGPRASPPMPRRATRAVVCRVSRVHEVVGGGGMLLERGEGGGGSEGPCRSSLRSVILACGWSRYSEFSG